MGEPQTINIVKISSSIFIVLLLITVLAGTIMVNTSVFADEPLPTDTKSATASVNVTAACTLSGGNNTYTKSITPGNTIEINPISTGTTPEGNAIKAVCNDPGGFGLYAIGYSGDSYTSSTHTDLIASSAGTSNNIHTATSGGSSNDSYWAMKLSSVSGEYTPTIENDYNTYQVVPANFTKVASLNKATDSDNTSTTPTTAAEGSSVYATYKVGASSSQVADTYTSKVKYVLVHPGSMAAGTYTIAFNANGGTGTMASQTGLYNFEEQTLNQMSGITAPDGYKFAGWCDVQDQTASGVVSGADPQTTCTGTSYADQGTVLPSVAAANSTYNLYAMWKESNTFDKAFANAGKSKYNNYYKMQDASSSICSAVDTGEIGQLIDARDNNVYYVGKLADNKCWMLDNLRLDPTAVALATLQSNTNASNTTLGYLKNGGGTTSDQYATTSVANWTSSYSFSAPLINATDKNNTTTSYGAGSGKIGVYYNYCAASAGSYCYGNGTSAGTPSGNATEDLCPTGWRMPGGSGIINLTAIPPTGEFQNLYNYYNTTQTATDTNSLQYNLSLPLSGNFNSGSANNQGSYGWWWSSTRNSTEVVYNLRVNASRVLTTNIINRGLGYSLRCVAQ